MCELKPFFNDLDESEKQKFFIKAYENKGIFEELFPEKDHIELDSKNHSLRLRADIFRLLLTKKIIKKEVYLENLHEILSDEMREYDFPSGVNSVSKFFYENDHQFEENFLDYVQFLYQNYFKFPFYFQKVPTIRIQTPDSKNNEHYPRYHTDLHLGHPPQEINVWLPLTEVGKSQKHGLRLMSLKNTKNLLQRYDYDLSALYKDSIHEQNFSKECNSLASEPATEFTRTLIFDVRCLHSGEPMQQNTRVSIDIRIMPVKAYENMKYRFQGTGRRKIMFEPGQCYHELSIDRL